MSCAQLALNTELQVVDGKAPEWVELIPPADADGMVRGRDGRLWRWDAKAHVDVLGAYQARGIDMVIDWEHATQRRAPNGEEAPGAAWIKELQIRAGALWGRAEWTPRAENQVVAKEYRFLSPVFDYASGSLRIARMVTVALTNTPNLHLTALNREGEAPMSRSANLVAAIATVLGLQADAADDAVAQAINSIKSDKDSALSRAENAEKVNLERYVPRADYDALKTRAENAESTLKQRDADAHTAAVDAAIKGAKEAGKISPATEEYYRAQCSDAEGLQRFQEFVGKAPVIGDDSGLDGKKPKGESTALNAEEIASKARAYQLEQAKAGNEISTTAAVRHVTKES